MRSDFVEGLIDSKARRGTLLILSVALNVMLGLALMLCSIASHAFV
jgi:hypothetical protein